MVDRCIKLIDSAPVLISTIKLRLYGFFWKTVSDHFSENFQPLGLSPSEIRRKQPSQLEIIEIIFLEMKSATSCVGGSGILKIRCQDSGATQSGIQEGEEAGTERHDA